MNARAHLARVLFATAWLGWALGCPGGDDDAGDDDAGDDDAGDDDAGDDDTGDDDAGDDDSAPVPYNGCGHGAAGERGPGTWAEPIDAPYLPFFDRNDTSLSAEDQADAYDCAPTLGEEGPEVVYRFVADQPGTFRAEVACEGDVDVDLHLLSAPVVGGGQAAGCIDRAHIELQVEGLPAGEYWVAADSWSDGGGEYDGPYEIAFEWIADDQWTVVPLRDGVLWSRLRSPDLHGGDQTVNVLTVPVDPLTVDLQPHRHDGCQRVEDVVAELGAYAGINAGFFGDGCAPLDLIKADGVLLATNGIDGNPQRTLGWSTGTPPGFEWIDAGADWAAVSDGLGAYPSLVTGGSVQPEPDLDSSFFTSRHPRTAMGLTATGELLLVAVDGRTDAGDGLTIEQLAQLLIDLGAVDAVNLDGGGSTTMVVEDCWIGGVVNHPSDNGESDHHGARSVSDGLYVR